MTSRSPRASGDRGFTLAELLVVLAIVGVLSAIAVLVLPLFVDRATGTGCEQDRRTLERAVLSYQDREGSYPADLAALTDDDGVSSDVVGDRLVRDGYTLTYDRASGGISSCASARAAGGSPTAGPTPVGPTLSVASATATSRTQGSYKWGGILRLKVDGATPRAGARVTGTWSYTYAGNGRRDTGAPPGSCTVAADGACTLTYADSMQENVLTATFTVISVTGLDTEYVSPAPPVKGTLSKPSP